MKKIVLMRGVPGAGKTHASGEIVSRHNHIGDSSAVVLSADDFFVTPDGSYEWNCAGLDKAHCWNSTRLQFAIECEIVLIVMDNCHLTAADCLPSVRIAMEHGYGVELHEVVGPPDLSAAALLSRSVHVDHVDAQMAIRLGRQFDNKFTVRELCTLLKDRPCRRPSDTDMKRYQRRVLDFLHERYNEALTHDSCNGDMLRAALFALSLPAFALAKQKCAAVRPSNAPAPTNKIRVQITPNDGTKRPGVPLVVDLTMNWDHVRKAACSRFKSKSWARSRVFALDGKELYCLDDLSYAIGCEEKSATQDPVLVISLKGANFLPLSLRSGKKRAPPVGGADSAPAFFTNLSRLPLGMTPVYEDGGLRISLGSARDACDMEQLKRRGVTHILCVASDWKPLGGATAAAPVRVNFSAPCLDDGRVSLAQFTDIIAEFDRVIQCQLLSAHGEGTHVLVHCVVGRSRSPAVVAGWLMRTGKVRDLRAALKCVRECTLSENFFRHFYPILMQLPADDSVQCSACGWEMAASFGSSGGAAHPVLRWLRRRAGRPGRTQAPTHMFVSSSGGLRDLFVLDANNDSCELLGMVAAAAVALAGTPSELAEVWSGERLVLLVTVDEHDDRIDVVRRAVASIDSFFGSSAPPVAVAVAWTEATRCLRIVAPSVRHDPVLISFLREQQHAVEVPADPLPMVQFGGGSEPAQPVYLGGFHDGLWVGRRAAISDVGDATLADFAVVEWPEAWQKVCAEFRWALEMISIGLPVRPGNSEGAVSDVPGVSIALPPSSIDRFVETVDVGMLDELLQFLPKRLSSPAKRASALQVRLREFGLPKTCKDLGLRASRHEMHRNLVSLHYGPSANFDRTGADEARGAIVDVRNRFEFVALPFLKFWNSGERGAALDAAAGDLCCTEKVDGALALLYFYAGEWHVASQGSPDGAGEAAVTASRERRSFSELFWNCWIVDMGFPQLDAGAPSIGAAASTAAASGLDRRHFCYMFELFHQDLPILVPAPRNCLVLTGARHMTSLLEVDSRFAALLLGVTTVARHYPEVKSLDQAVALANSRDGRLHEGLVVRDERFDRVKVKSKAYVFVARFGRRPQHEITDAELLRSVVATGETGEFLVHFPEFSERIDRLLKN